MKFMVIALALVSSLVHAETLRQCVVTTKEKGSSLPPLSKTVYLASGRMNFISASESTSLKVLLAHEGPNADVYVNDQLGFIFKGNVSQGTFESARDKGTLSCGEGVQVGAIFQSQAGGATEPASDESILASCYAGDSKAAAADLVRVANLTSISVDSVTGTITGSRIENQCVKGKGSSVDDYVCFKYANVRQAYAVVNCDYDPNARP